MRCIPCIHADDRQIDGKIKFRLKRDSARAGEGEKDQAKNATTHEATLGKQTNRFAIESCACARTRARSDLREVRNELTNKHICIVSIMNGEKSFLSVTASEVETTFFSVLRAIVVVIIIIKYFSIHFYFIFVRAQTVSERGCCGS